MSTVKEARPRAEVRKDLARVRRLIEEGRVDEARTMAEGLADRWPDDPLVQQLAEVLAPPRVIGSDGPAARSHHAERAWLKQHARKYPGCWLAVYEDRLIAAHADLLEALRILRGTLGDVDAVLFFQPASQA